MDTTDYNQSYTYNHISNILNYNANLLHFIKYISLLIILFIYIIHSSILQQQSLIIIDMTPSRCTRAVHILSPSR